MAIDSYIYFANVRLKYEWTLCANTHTLVYTFTRSDSIDRCVMFWDVKRGITHIRSVDNLLGICGYGDFCAVTHKIESISKPYQITVYNSLGCIADCMTTELEPKFSVMTGNYVVIANASIVFLWQFKNPKTLFGIGVAVKARNKMRKAIQRMCHIDQKDGSLASQPPLSLDGSSSTATDTNMAKLLAIEPSQNPIVALATSETRSLFIARSNGNVIRYRLPELWPEVCIHATDKLPVRIEVNCDATQSYAEAALQEMQLNEAEVGFVMCQHYQGIDFVKKLRNIQSEVVRRAEVRAHFGDFDGAERLYLSTDRCDLAIDLRRRLGDWFRVAQLAKEFGAVVRDSELIDVWNALGDHYYDKAQWPQASEFYGQGGDFKKLVHCLFRMGDYSTMESLIHELPDGHSLLPEIARIFTWVSLAAPAAKALIKCDQLKEAVEVCIQLNDWSLAFQLTQVSSSSSSSDGDSSEDDVLTKTSLRRRLIGHLRASVKRMLEQSRPFEAIEMLKGAGYFLDSAKLLFRETKLAQSGGAKLKTLKKFYVMIGLLIDKHHEQSKLSIENSNQQESIFTGEEGDTSRSDLGVFGDQATFTERSRRRETGGTEAVAHGKQNDLLQLSNSYEITRLIDQPWRGAEACHYLMLSQHHLYLGLFEQALRTAILLRDYDDIFDARKIHSIIALCAVKSGAFATASKAFMKLQNLPGWSTFERQKLDDLIFEIFTRYPPKNLTKSASSIEMDVMLERF